MNQCAIFRLNINLVKDTCIFTLSWGEIEQIPAKLAYSKDLNQLYQDWKGAYQNAYPSFKRGITIEDDEDFTPTENEVDWKSRATEAEDSLVTYFNRWLGDQELLKIRNKITETIINNNINNGNKAKLNQGNCVDLLIACDDPDLEKLPWETWEILPKSQQKSSPKIHIFRTLFNIDKNINHQVISLKHSPRVGKTRILVIIADLPSLELDADIKALEVIKKVAILEIIEFKNEKNREIFKEKLINLLEDNRGWDLLIFAGHGQETNGTGGKLRLAENPDIDLSLSDIYSALLKAKNNGLRCAIFNSCEGISSAKYLIDLGLHQVLIMREKIHYTVAPKFLKYLSENLANYQSIHIALQKTCQSLEDQKISEPSSYLIPSLYCHSSKQIDWFKIERLGWSKIWLDFKPKQWEIFTFSSLCFISLFYSVTYRIIDPLIQLRILTQSVYRDLTTQLIEAESPIQLIVIDQNSINKAKQDLPNFEPFPMDRRYLAKIFNKLNDFNPKVVGFNYEIYQEEQYEEQLQQSINNLINDHQTWLIFSKNFYDNRDILSNKYQENWSLQGDMILFYGEMSLPKKSNIICDQDYCSLPYLLTLSYLINQNNDSNIPQPNLANKISFQENIISYLKSDQGDQKIIPHLEKSFSPFNWLSLIDFSIPPHQVYNLLSAEDFLKSSNALLTSEGKNKIFIISPGIYQEGNFGDYSPQYPLPFATSYWCDYARIKQEKPCSFNQSRASPQITGGETFAYMTYQLLTQRRVTAIPDYLLVIIATILGKWLMIKFRQKSIEERKQLVQLSFLGLIIFNLTNLQIYIWTPFLIPCLFPSFIFSSYLIAIFRR
jgi:hypothetical protein